MYLSNLIRPIDTMTVADNLKHLIASGQNCVVFELYDAPKLAPEEREKVTCGQVALPTVRGSRASHAFPVLIPLPFPKPLHSVL